ncbi:helix-turn-helix domain-containing protein [Ensifer adhaerens]|uniref:helix-turn-helix domain-containing protein n=1 Tax=Ensifer adhaerens TaxID=106592 RepID=UPI001CC00C69|nr:helix-turn-helix transcriptional regulator [Ensifer adhaerens]MBZ7921630.1 helix-turn-helix domain-containing protein [Ensifer adhaerens]UAX94049.1 helix-turn-helix domain-containing protein [Ensifer adhaerens]UAY01683.1 helix-turn-helix domain-containing protein [Ensifer adhaerens]UAY09067.1 helix-turn-helix domain-containing protein [Ensifer adhaerens]
MTKHLKAATAEIDREIGARIRRFRKSRDMSQGALAAKLGITFQQLQKYEKGVNRVSTSALILICKALQITPNDVIGSFVDTINATLGVKLAEENTQLKARLAEIGRTASGHGQMCHGAVLSLP